MFTLYNVRYWRVIKEKFLWTSVKFVEMGPVVNELSYEIKLTIVDNRHSSFWKHFMLKWANMKTCCGVLFIRFYWPIFFGIKCFYFVYHWQIKQDQKCSVYASRPSRHFCSHVRMFSCLPVVTDEPVFTIEHIKCLAQGHKTQCLRWVWNQQPLNFKSNTTTTGPQRSSQTQLRQLQGH